MRPTSTLPPTPAPELGTTLYTYHGHAGRVNAVAWAPGGQGDSTVQIWDALTGANVVTYHGYEDGAASTFSTSSG